MMPTSETNARAIARHKGYLLVVEPDGTVVAIADGVRQAAAVSWPAMLAWIVRAPRVTGGPSAA